MTLQEFSQVYAKLALQLNDANADEMKIRAYYDVLKDYEIETVAMAAKDMAEHSEWFPKTSEWRKATDEILGRRRQQLDQVIRERSYARIPLCLACEDTGWKPSGDDRRGRCECQKLRRLEIVGRRPLPELPTRAELLALPPAERASDEQMAAIRERLGMVVKAKGMP